jgi:sugar phosphate permease
VAIATMRRAVVLSVLVLTGRRRVFYGWWLLAGSVLAMMVASGVSFWAFGLYIEPLEEEFGWSRAAVSLGFSVSLLVSGLLSPLVGRWIDGYGPRRVILVGSVLTAATYVLLATTENLWQWYTYQSINAVFRQMMFFIPFQALISRWFDRRRAVAIGILATGFSLAGMIVLPVMRVVIDLVGWDGSFIFSGVVVAVLFIPLALFVIRDQPADVGATVDDDPVRPGDASRRGHSAAAMGGLTVRAAIRTPVFWLLALAFMALFFGLFGWMVHAVPYFESVGRSPGWAAALVAIAAGGGVVSRLLFGFGVDRWFSIAVGSFYTVGFMGLSIFVLLVTGGAVWGIVLFMIAFMIGSGGGPMLEPLLLTRAFGVRHFATILGMVVTVETMGQVVSPVVAGAIFDSTGQYDWALAMFSLAFLVSLLLFMVAVRLPFPYRARSADASAATAEGVESGAP